MRVLAVVGESGSGKTTLIESLIRHFVARGERVAAIKHTHHPINDRNEGDTARFLAAGASPVIFAGAGEAIVFPQQHRIRFTDPRELLIADAAVMLVEGFKQVDGWPRVELERNAWREPAEVAAMFDKIAGPCP